MLETRRRRIFEIIQIGYTGDFASRLFDILLITMIAANLFIAIFLTFDCFAPYTDVLHAVEWVTVFAFAIEYILRLWTADLLYPKLSRGRAIRKYMCSFNGVIELLAFLPAFLPFFFPSGLVAFRMFRVVRIFRLFRINAYYDSFNVITDVIVSKKNQLVSSIFIILVLMMASSLCMYSLEHEAQPEVFRNAFSGFWWAVSTLLTVGYGDIYPITIPGRIFGIVITFLGVGMVAIPTGILSAGFVERYTRMKSFDNSERDIRFVKLEIDDGHPWADRRVRELSVPPGLLLVMIQRRGSVLIPRGELELLEGDTVVLGAEKFQDEIGIHLKELVLRERHPWTGRRIQELDISRQTVIISVRRGGSLLIPTGSLCLKEGDILLIYSKRMILEAMDMEV